MIEHPWIELQVLIKEKWLTQKAFASILWKKVSEVNELLKWKRNITIQRDYLLHKSLWTPTKYWILKQVDYEYSLIDIDESDTMSSWAVAKDFRWDTNEINIQDSLSQNSSEWQNENDEDFKNRARIFKSF
jgi:plasmid maintenance system antidote protein VapI